MAVAVVVRSLCWIPRGICVLSTHSLPHVHSRCTITHNIALQTYCCTTSSSIVALNTLHHIIQDYLTVKATVQFLNETLPYETKPHQTTCTFLFTMLQALSALCAGTWIVRVPNLYILLYTMRLGTWLELGWMLSFVRDWTRHILNVWGSRRVNDLGCQFSTINWSRKTLLVAALLLLASSCWVVDGILHFTALRQHCPILLSAAFFSPVMSKYLWLVMKMRYFGLQNMVDMLPMMNQMWVWMIFLRYVCCICIECMNQLCTLSVSQVCMMCDHFRQSAEWTFALDNLNLGWVLSKLLYPVIPCYILSYLVISSQPRPRLSSNIFS